jgi:hypothetical protein
MSKKDTVKLFNTALKDLINDFLAVYPDDSGLKLMKIVYKMLKKVNKRLPQRNFHLYFASRYESLIAARNDTKIVELLQIDMLEYLENDVISNMIKQIHENLFNKWKCMSDEQRNTIWNHIDVLMRINKICETIP